MISPPTFHPFASLYFAANSVFYLPYLLDKKLNSVTESTIFEDCQRFKNPPGQEYSVDFEAVTREIIGTEEIVELEANILKQLVIWRDYVASIEEESPNFVASNSLLRKIACNWSPGRQP